MRHLTFVRSAALVAVVALFSACGDSGSTGPDFDDTFTAEDINSAAFGVIFGSEQIMENLHWGYPQVGDLAAPAFVSATGKAPAWRHPSRFPQPAAGSSLGAYLSALQASAPGCAVSGHGAGEDPFEPYDGNDNGVGDDFLVRMDCHSLDSIGEGVTVAYTEGVEIRIKERTGVLWGWDASLKSWYSDERSDGLDHDEGVEEVKEHMVITASRAEYGQTYHFAEDGLDGEDPYDHEQGGDLTLAFTPDDDPIVFDELFPAGTVTVTGRFWMTDLEGPNLDWRIRTEDPLEWSGGCAVEEGQPFVDGTMLVLLNGQSDKGFSASALPCTEGWDVNVFGDEAIPAARTFQGRGFTLPKH